jgi:hypothetical protein
MAASGTPRRGLPALLLPAMLRLLESVVQSGKPPEALLDDRGELLRELMAVFDELPAGLREAINYAPEPLDPKGLATLCRRHGAANVLAMIELKMKRRRGAEAAPNEKPS